MGEHFKKQLTEEMSSMGIALSEEQVRQFETYYDLLIEWNNVMNLTAITEESEVITKHFTDSASLIKAVPSILNASLKIADIGTGAGFPGIPLKILNPQLEIVLMDSLNKRIRFLEDTVQKLGLTNVTAVHARAEELAKNKSYREKMDFCCSRAVANLSTLSEYCLPFVKKGGYFISYKTEQVQEEINQGQKAIKVLGGGNTEAVFFTLPGTDYQRSLVKIEKQAATPAKYPRKAGTPAKEPIR